MLLAVVIPVYNERDTLPTLLERLERTTPPRRPDTGEPLARVIVLVDDGSTDGTRELVRSFEGRTGVDVRLHDRNRGKGAALRTGFARAIELNADVVIVQDGDLEYDPADHGVVLAPILDGRADAVIGSRFIGQTHRVLYYWHAVANGVITTLSNMLTNLNLTDVECCFEAFRREIVQGLRLKENRFGIEPELVAKVARARVEEPPGRSRAARIYEVAVSYAGRTYAEGKKITWRDAVSALRCILKYNLFR